MLNSPLMLNRGYHSKQTIVAVALPKVQKWFSRSIAVLSKYEMKMLGVKTLNLFCCDCNIGEKGLLVFAVLGWSGA